MLQLSLLLIKLIHPSSLSQHEYVFVSLQSNKNDATQRLYPDTVNLIKSIGHLEVAIHPQHIFLCCQTPDLSVHLSLVYILVLTRLPLFVLLPLCFLLAACEINLIASGSHFL